MKCGPNGMPGSSRAVPPRSGESCIVAGLVTKRLTAATQPVDMHRGSSRRGRRSSVLPFGADIAGLPIPTMTAHGTLTEQVGRHARAGLLSEGPRYCPPESIEYCAGTNTRSHVAEDRGVSRQCVSRWAARYLAEATTVCTSAAHDLVVARHEPSPPLKPASSCSGSGAVRTGSAPDSAYRPGRCCGSCAATVCPTHVTATRSPASSSGPAGRPRRATNAPTRRAGAQGRQEDRAHSCGRTPLTASSGS